MAPIRRSKLSSLSALAALGLGAAIQLACGAGTPMVTATEMPSAQRRPDGVHVEPPSVVPTPVDRAPARGIVALRLPTGASAIEDLVRAYLAAFVREDIDGLERQLLTSDWTPLGGGSRAALKSQWTQRVKNFDYKQLAGVEIARIDQIERYEWSELAGPRAPARPSEMRQGDVLVRVPIAVARVGTDQLFPDVLVLLMRREEGGRMRISGVGEEGGN